MFRGIIVWIHNIGQLTYTLTVFHRSENPADQLITEKRPHACVGGHTQLHTGDYSGDYTGSMPYRSFKARTRAEITLQHRSARQLGQSATQPRCSMLAAVGLRGYRRLRRWSARAYGHLKGSATTHSGWCCPSCTDTSGYRCRPHRDTEYHP